MSPLGPTMTQHKHHHDGHGNADAGIYFHLPAYSVPLETAALIESRKHTLQTGGPTAAFSRQPRDARGRENATFPVEHDAHHKTVVGDPTTVLLVTLPLISTRIIKIAGHGGRRARKPRKVKLSLRIG